MSTNAYAAKRAIIDRITAVAALPGTPLSGQNAAILYAWNGATAKEITLYGGGVTFDQPEADEAVDGERRRLVAETAHVGLHIRVARAPDPATVDQIRTTDEMCEEIGDWLGDLLTREPRIAGGASKSRILSGQGDYVPVEDKAVSRLSYVVEVTSHFPQPSS
jgi:hypothetical protein